MGEVIKEKEEKEGETSILAFVSRLTAVSRTSHMHNPYHNSILANNLRQYLVAMQSYQPTILLMGEALGYRGGLQTGIPFTSERLVEAGLPPLNLPGLRCLNRNKRVLSEQSATIVWQTLAHLYQQSGHLPLLWNAYPFHPYRRYKPQSNRPPTAVELTQGTRFWRELLHLFPIKTILAVGNKASKALAKADVTHQKIRHPAHGGKADFVQGLLRLWPDGSSQPAP